MTPFIPKAARSLPTFSDGFILGLFSHPPPFFLVSCLWLPLREVMAYPPQEPVLLCLRARLSYVVSVCLARRSNPGGSFSRTSDQTCLVLPFFHVTGNECVTT